MKAFISALLVAVLGFGIKYYVERKIPDVRYQLSSAIPIDGPESQMNRYVQQLEIANLGNAPAQRIVVQFRKQIGQATVVKDSMADSVKQYQNPGGLEVVYDSLPGGRKFRCVLSMAGTSLQEQDIEVKHQDGTGRPILSTAESPWWSPIFSVGFYLVLLFYIWSSARDLTLSHYRSKTKYAALGILKGRKPLLMNEGAWQDLRKEALPSAYDEPKSYEHDITRWSGYLVLNGEKPPYLSAEEWTRLLTHLSGRLVRYVGEVEYQAVRFNNAQSLHKVLEVSRPINLSAEEWRQVEESRSRAYVHALLGAYFATFSTAKAQQAFGESRPAGVIKSEWENFVRGAEAYSFVAVIVEAEYAFGPTAGITSELLERLDDRHRRVAEKFLDWRRTDLLDLAVPSGARKFLGAPRPEWMSEGQFGRLREISEKCLTMDDLARRSKVLLAGITNILKGLPIQDQDRAVDDVSSKEWAQLKDLESKISLKQDANVKRSNELDQTEGEMNSLKALVSRQLDILNRFLDDPTVLDHIEPYEQVFAPGNLKTLKTLAARRNQ